MQNIDIPKHYLGDLGVMYGIFTYMKTIKKPGIHVGKCNRHLTIECPGYT